MQKSSDIGRALDRCVKDGSGSLQSFPGQDGSTKCHSMKSKHRRDRLKGGNNEFSLGYTETPAEGPAKMTLRYLSLELRREAWAGDV